MNWSRALLTLPIMPAPIILSGVLTFATPSMASGRHSYFSFSAHRPRVGFGYRYRPHLHYRPFVRLGSPYLYYYRSVYGRTYSRPTYAPYQSYAYGSGAIRTLVKPKRAEVYIDGHYAGVVDDFDGTFQKLYLAPGEHELELRLEGHRTYRQHILVTPSHTQKIHHEMVALGPAQDRDPAGPVLEGREESQEIDAPPAPAPVPPSAAPVAPGPPIPPSASRVFFGVLTLRVQPAQAEVRIDGEVWGHLGGMEELSIHLPAGLHGIELVRSGQVVFSTEVDILTGQATPLNIRLGP